VPSTGRAAGDPSRRRRLHGPDVAQQRNGHADERRLVLVVQRTSGSGSERSVDVVAIAAAADRHRSGQVGGRRPATEPAAPGPATEPRPAVRDRRSAVGDDARRRQRDL